MRRKHLLIVAAIVGGLIGLPIAWYLGSPLFINRTVDEAFPVAQAAVAPEATTVPTGLPTATEPPAPTATQQPTEVIVESTATAADEPMATIPPTSVPTPTPAPTEAPTEIRPTPVPAEPIVLKSGQFHAVEHRGVGDATIYQLPDGQRILRFENFDVLNGPDLYVYLSSAPDAFDAATILNSQWVSLGRLKGNVGNQNYELPPDLDIGAINSVSVWCQQFSVNFATAPLR